MTEPLYYKLLISSFGVHSFGLLQRNIGQLEISVFTACRFCEVCLRSRLLPMISQGLRLRCDKRSYRSLVMANVPFEAKFERPLSSHKRNLKPAFSWEAGSRYAATE